MAIAFARVSIHSRSKGHSAVAASSYRSGTKLLDNRTGLTHDFSNRHDVAYSIILLPEGGAEAFLNREFLWNTVENSEKRCDAQVCKDIVLALPKELDLNNQIELTKRFAKTYFVDNGLPADISIHAHGTDNPHAHILIATRRLNGKKFAKYKARDLNPRFAKGYVVENDYWGEHWRDMQNEFFAEKNLDISVDLNHIISEYHHGKNQVKNEHYLLENNKIIKEARLELDATSILNHLQTKYSVFTRRDVEKLLFKTFKDSQNPEAYLAIVEQILNHENVINIGKNDREKNVFTTREQYNKEAKLRDNLEIMLNYKHQAKLSQISKLSAKYDLNYEQSAALEYIASSSNISVIIGRPGVGKSYLLKPVKEYFESNNYHVIGAALSGKVAKSMQDETEIQSATIASLIYKINNDYWKLTNKHILVIDEAGMVDFDNMAFLIEKAKEIGCKVILLGDPDQLKPINKGEIFRGIAAITGYIELENIKRQNDLGDRQASINLAHSKISEAIDHYVNKGAVSFCDTQEIAINNLINDWQQNITNTSIKNTILLAFTKASVATLNVKAREMLKTKKLLGDEEIEFTGFDKNLKLSVGDRLLFRQNNQEIGVRNGDLGTVKSVYKNKLQVKLDSGEELNIPQIYTAIDYGYALTVHKSQGMTIANTKVLIDSKYWDRNLSFVALTRHKENLHIYADKINHPDLGSLKHTLTRFVTKDNVIDWPFNENHEAMKFIRPVIMQYETLLEKSKHLTGYYREKIDKKIQKIAQSISEDKKLITHITQTSPKIANKIKNNAKYILAKDISRGI